MDAASGFTFLSENWGWALGLATAMLSLTGIGVLLNPARKDDLALWLLGAHADTWHQSFTRLFDAVFGARHLSLKCFVRSAIASLLSVCLIWLLMGSADTIGLRLQSDLDLGAVLVIGLAINVLADYLSLLETRWLLSRMPRPWWAQVGVLLLDLILTAAIIWIAIFLYIRSPLHEGEVESFAEILGVFSIFSVFFYSTFLTSVWTWAYIASSWLMRLLTRLRVDYWLDVEGKPVRVFFLVLAVCVGATTFAGSMLVGATLGQRQDGVTALDRSLCTVFQGRVCMDVANLTPDEQAQLDFITLACEGGVTEECLYRAFGIYEVDGATAARLWRASCNGGDMLSCSNLGYLHHQGIGVSPNPIEAVRLYVLSCDAAVLQGCSNLGMMHELGIGLEPDPIEAERLYRLACDGDDSMGCTNLGLLLVRDTDRESDPAEAARLLREGCDAGIFRGCTGLGFLSQRGLGVERDPIAAARLFRQGCNGGDAWGCSNLGYMHEAGIGMEVDTNEAARLYRQGCELGDDVACGWADTLENQ